MNQSSTKLAPHFTGAASLAAIGMKLRELDLLAPIREHVQIPQKTVKDTPFEKVSDALTSMLAGATGLVEVNTLLRSDPALQVAFGRRRCAEQSVIQDTLSACTASTVEQMEQAMNQIYQQHSQGYRHNYQQGMQILDVDMTGLPCGPKAALASKGYFANQRNRRGRQMGRVLATRCGEVVTDQLFGGKAQLTEAFQPLVLAAERALGLDEAKRSRTLLRVDAGGGSLQDVNWALARGYQFLGKEYSGQRARRLAQSVTTWVDDPHQPGRQVGRVQEPAPEYVRDVMRIAVRCRKQNGQWGISVLISTLSPEELWALIPAEGKSHLGPSPTRVLLAQVLLYDRRGGGIETSFKSDKQMGLGKRAKKRFAAQQMVMLLGSLAHNVIIWAHLWLTEPASKLLHYGPLRMVRDVFHVSGFLLMDALGRIRQIVLNQSAPLASLLLRPLQSLLASAHIAINLGQT